MYSIKLGARIQASQLDSYSYLVTIEDISERKMLEKKLQETAKMEAIGTLAGGVAHDFNNILAMIMGYSSLLIMERKKKGEPFEMLEKIHGAVDQASSLTKQLLSFARGGKYKVFSININKLVEKTIEMFGRTKKELVIEKNLFKKIWNIEADAGQIDQVFLNLLINAHQAMPGGGEIFVETGNIEINETLAKYYDVKPGKYVKIKVADKGIGMDEKTKARIFEPFFTTKEMGRGTGLGLASVYGIVKNHAGFIDVESLIGKGTTFIVYFPASKNQVYDQMIKKEKKVASGHETVLVIDDQPDILETTKMLLANIGYTMIVANSGDMALEIFKQKKEEIDIIILDMIMPGKSGDQTFNELRNIDPACKVMLSSGYSLEGQAEAIIKRGCNGFIQKPFGLYEISKKIREVLDN